MVSFQRWIKLRAFQAEAINLRLASQKSTRDVGSEDRPRPRLLRNGLSRVSIEWLGVIWLFVVDPDSRRSAVEACRRNIEELGPA